MAYRRIGRMQVEIVIGTMTIHNFIRMNAKVDIDFHRYEDEDIDLDHNDKKKRLFVNFCLFIRVHSWSLYILRNFSYSRKHNN